MTATDLWVVLKVVEVNHISSFTFQDLRWTLAAHQLLQNGVHLFIAEQILFLTKCALGNLLSAAPPQTTNLSLICADWYGLCRHSSPKQSEGLHVASPL